MTTPTTSRQPKVENWAYPFKTKGGQDVTDPRLYQQALAHAHGGTYLLGSNGLWHGGIHFDEGTAAYLDQSRIHCIADGEVVAYRIDDKVRRFAPDEGSAREGKTYSTSFVLVRHRLEAPRLPIGNETPPSLVFFSLYMHLLDWAGYEADPALPRPAFWRNDRFRVSTRGGKLNVRQKPSSQALVQAELNNGSQVRISGTGDWCQLVEILDNGLRPLPGRQQVGLGYVARRYLKPEAAPEAQNSVFVLDPPFPIKAGALLGHPGLYEGQQQIHLETFSCDDLPAFIERSRAWAARLPESDKTLLKIHAGASKLITHRSDIDASHPPKISDPGVQVGVDLILSQAQLDALPAADKIVVPARNEGGICTQEQRWWHLKGLLADGEGKPIEGWLCEQEFITTRHSQWEWVDYKTLAEDVSPAAKLAHHLNTANVLSYGEKRDFKNLINEASSSPTIKEIESILRKQDIESNLHFYSPTRYSKPSLYQAICRLAVRHKTEWISEPNYWNELDKLVGNSNENPNFAWQREKSKIETISWWSHVASTIRTHIKDPWHFHPINLIEATQSDIRELRVRAFIRMIRVGEGTSGKSGYEKLFGGQSFIQDYSKNFDDHPNIKIKRQGYTSSAAGAYQVMAYTWNDKAMIRIRKKLQIKDFTPESQDRFCIALLRYKVRSNPLLMICNGQIEEAIKKCSTEWASLPTSPYGQPMKTMEESLMSYERFLNEEIEGQTELYLRKGFLSTYL
ncbi:MAG: hypothetical protein PGN19_02990 [Pseudomonas oryzihabitans]